MPEKKPFRFQQFTVLQLSEVFRVGTDAVLLGSLCSIGADNLLEVGTGSGIISLMLAQRNQQAKITALDIDANAANLAAINFKNSPFHERLHAVCKNYLNFKPNRKYHQIISNPPYFELNSSTKDTVARQQSHLSFEDLIKKTSELLSDQGIFSVIIPKYSEEEFETICKRNHLYLFKKINIIGLEGVSPKRCILEFQRANDDCEVIDFIVEKAPRKYSDQYLELTKEFHIFGKNQLI